MNIISMNETLLAEFWDPMFSKHKGLVLEADKFAALSKKGIGKVHFKDSDEICCSELLAMIVEEYRDLWDDASCSFAGHYDNTVEVLQKYLTLEPSEPADKIASFLKEEALYQRKERNELFHGCY